MAMFIAEPPLFVLFSCESITDLFASGANICYLVNANANVLIHGDSEQILAGTSFSDDIFVQRILNTQHQENPIQEIYIAPDSTKYFATGCRIANADAAIITQIASDVVFESITAVTRRNIYLSIAVWLFGIIIILFFARSLSVPIIKLKDASKTIAEGNYHITLHNKNSDETSFLTESILSMSNVLLNFEKLSNKVLASLARKGLLKTGGESKQAVIFISDIRGFTAASESLSPQEVVEMLNEYMDKMVACVLLCGGTIDKFIGDAIVAHWGALDYNKDNTDQNKKHAINGICSSLMMRAALMCLNAGRKLQGKHIIKIGCALNAGQVFAGLIGSEQRLEFTVIGSTVNFVDRIETFNKPFGTEILISESLQKLTGEYFITQEMPSITDDNQEKIRIFAVINIRSQIEGENTLKLLEQILGIDTQLAKTCIGKDGPQTLSDLRTLLDISTPDLTKVDTGGDEKKYALS
jgi:adenylate cyclase